MNEIPVPLHQFTKEEVLMHLRKDNILSPLIRGELKPRHTTPSVYEYLVRAINFQQLSGKAALTIHNRFLALFDNRYPEPHKLVKMTADELRSVGLSRQKSQYVGNVARFFIENELFNHNWNDLDDDEVIDLLTQIKGVGKWTSEMVLIFNLFRPDVLPLDDLVVKNNIVKLYNLEHLTGRTLNQEIESISNQWKPYRTTASLYLWNWSGTIN